MNSPGTDLGAAGPARTYTGTTSSSRLSDLAAEVLSRVLVLPADDQVEVLALVVATWVYAREMRRGRRGMSDLDAIKAAIRAELKAQGCTQLDLARYLGVSMKHVNSVLKGRQAGTFGLIEAMAHAVGLSVVAR